MPNGHYGYDGPHLRLPLLPRRQNDRKLNEPTVLLRPRHDRSDRGQRRIVPKNLILTVVATLPVLRQQRISETAADWFERLPRRAS